MLDRLKILYDTKKEFTPKIRDIYKQVAEEDALKYFLFGVKNPLEVQVRCKKPSTLGKERRIELEFESSQKRRSFLLFKNLMRCELADAAAEAATRKEDAIDVFARELRQPA